ncbi:Phosphorylase kinase alphabeta [Candidatus Methylobacter favarea]|uniref:Phosphorylase kinase alphabeta n=1 Tax=Candidatus Methylobacter favarea TaxID=2707345 RepID=A0A8S0Y9X9_9GAMM|nr:glycoside hydrolase family 15 protein [Candidatus Methylobacter favarea]CAA9890821.1 Phosphorylase kinase alphabeta [Candidatus Methylobacter favarea]
MKLNSPHDKLENYYRQVQEIILNRQDWVSGLLPASTAVNVHGNYNDAWVRDNVYSILAAWGLALAYRRDGEANGRTYLLEQSVVKLMRGLLTAMMRQAPKVEKFKHTQNPLDALHAKYDTKSGACVVGDQEWGHLQLDATSLFLLMLAQMIASGLRIVFTIDEVNFVQNLVHYISRTYRTPDYGIWERGHKTNHGIAELNASSIGMAKAALEALSGFNLFGQEGGQASVVHVISDDVARTRITLESLLPRESISKETDSALLSITGFPAFAVDNQAIRAETEAIICEKLEGRYGCKRFLLDGHQTAIEDHYRHYYDPYELKQFTDIECEWPLFFTYLLLANLFKGDNEAALHYHSKLESLVIEQNGQQLLPELYSVPIASIDAEKARPHSQERVPNDNIPLVWAQSLFILASLIQDGLLSCDDIDPLGRHKIIKQNPDCTLQVLLLAQDEAVQSSLREDGICTQILAEIAPVQIREANELAEAYTHVGRNDRIGLTGRPLRQLRTLATSKMYILAGERLLFLPQCLNQKGFYLAMDNRLLIQRLRLEFAYLYKHWDRRGNPLLIMTIKHNMLGSHNREILIEFIKELQQGTAQGISLQVGKLADFEASSSYEKINYLHDFKFSKASWQETQRPCFQALPVSNAISIPLSPRLLTEWEISEDALLIEQLKNNSNLYAQLEALNLLSNRHGLEYDTGLVTADGKICTVRDLLEEIYERAGDQHAWYIVRRCAGLLGKYDINLEQTANEILIRQHALTVGRAYSGRATLRRPADSSEILQTIRTYNNNDASERIIIQELIIYLGLLIKSKPELFADMYTVRVGHILQLIIVRQKREASCTLDQAFTLIMSLPPYQLSKKVQETLEDYSNTESQLDLAETLHFEGDYQKLAKTWSPKTLEPMASEETMDWYEWREQKGSVGRENTAFFACVWDILHHCRGLTIGEKLDSNRRLDSEATLSQMTSGEQSFKLLVNHLLNKIQAPVYRQLTVETLKAIASIFRSSSSLHIDDTLVTDIIIGHAVKICWLQSHPEYRENYDENTALAWQAFYHLPPYNVAAAILDALLHLLDNNKPQNKEIAYDSGR